MRLTLLFMLLGGCNQALDLVIPDGGSGPSQPRPSPGRTPTRERCNGVDDDLDGFIDEGCPIRLTNNPADDVMPSLDHGRVAWIREPRPSSGYYGEGDLYVRDLPDGVERHVASAATLPSLSGDRVAYWTPSRLSYGVVDLNTGEETLIPFTGYDHGRPWLSGDTMVYSQYDPVESDAWQENYNIYIWHVGDKLPTALVVDYDGQRLPVLDGSKIFFSDDRNGHHVISLSHLFELWTFDLSTGIEAPLVSRASDGSLGMIEAHDLGRTLTYLMGGFTTNGPPPFPAVMAATCQLLLVDAVGAVTPLTEVADYDTSACPLLAWGPDNAALAGDVAVHELNPGGSSDLELIDLASMLRVQVTDYPRRSTQPRLDGRYLVWQDDRHDDWELYYIDLHDRAQGDLYPEGALAMKRLMLIALIAGCGRSQVNKLHPDMSSAPDAGTVDDCPGGRNACGDCAPPQPEECNGRDDNCDGVVDEGCSTLWPQLPGTIAPIRLFAGSVVVAQPGTGGAYTSAQTYVYRLLYAASAGATPEALAQTPTLDGGLLQNESEQSPDFDGTWVVWLRQDYYDSSNAAVMAMTLADRQPASVSQGLVVQGPPALSGGRVVFAATPAGQGDTDIELVELTTGTRTDSSFAGVPESAPDIFGDWVVYERRQLVGGDAQVRAIHVPDGVLDAPSDGLDGTNTAPAIDGTHVVWSRTPATAAGATATSEVWWYDLSTRVRKKLGAGQNAHINGTLICWDGPDGVWLADSDSGRSARMVTSGGNCDLSGRRLAWIGHQGLTYRDLTKSEP